MAREYRNNNEPKPIGKAQQKIEQEKRKRKDKHRIEQCLSPEDYLDLEEDIPTEERFRKD